MAEQKKQSFLHGAALLAAATAIVKVIGAFYKIPLNAIIGTKGFAYFNTAYNIYTVLLLVSTAGLPVAMSRMISAANSLGNTKQVKRIYKTAQTIFLSLGIPFGILMTCFAKPLAVFQEQPDAWAAIACLGPSAFLMCLVAAFRGFFQGHRNMMPTSVSQVLEASCKLVVGLAVAFAIKKMTAQIPWPQAVPFWASPWAAPPLPCICSTSSGRPTSLWRRATAPWSRTATPRPPGTCWPSPFPSPSAPPVCS